MVLLRIRDVLVLRTAVVGVSVDARAAFLFIKIVSIFLAVLGHNIVGL